MGKGFTIWLTGLSGAGKSTLAERLAPILRQRGHQVELLDGDVVRTNLSAGLGFSKEDRDTNIRRIAFVANLLTRNGVAVITAAISPYRSTRDEARSLIGRFFEVYVACNLDELIRRDVKGLYARALRGEIPNFTGVSDPYEPPLAPEVVVESDRETVDESVAKIVARLEELGYLHPASATTVNGSTVSTRTIAPHGGVLVDRTIPAEERTEFVARARTLRSVRLSARQLSDLHMIAIGGFSPLTGFLGHDDYLGVVEQMHLADGTAWPIPVTLAVDDDVAASVRVGDEVALLSPDGDPIGTLEVTDRYSYDKKLEARHVYRTDDEAHPGVRAVYAQGSVLLAGPIRAVPQPAPAAFAPYWLSPAETRAAFAQRGWHTVVGFQTRNPVHRAHEYIQKCALEIVDGLLLHPLVGETKSDDVPAEVRMRCYETLLEGYYPSNRVLLAVNPAAMRYAGPREAVFHALVRQNYGCTHFIVGRDHAGVGNYYGTYDAQRIFSEFAPGEIAITPLKFEHTFYCRRCAGMASSKTCPHDAADHVVLSGSKVRAMLQAREIPPPEFSRPEVARLLVESS